MVPVRDFGVLLLRLWGTWGTRVIGRRTPASVAWRRNFGSLQSIERNEIQSKAVVRTVPLRDLVEPHAVDRNFQQRRLREVAHLMVCICSRHRAIHLIAIVRTPH
ncbi:hypothetical protein BKA63DRAFT_67223 [Paraphoma chrysanthemicola]|nr:hypothetical protein BKA63DRAFT_67223 [Paraphoma chrysanthemicola]